MDQLQCTGRERSLELCPFDGWGNQDCYHYEDAGVQCVDNQSNNNSESGMPMDQTKLVPANKAKRNRWATSCLAGPLLN